jgi:hypothetical protein
MIEWTSEQFSFYNNRIQDLMDEFNSAPTEEAQKAVIGGLVGLIDTFIDLGREDIADLQSAEPSRLRALSTRIGIKLAPGAGAARMLNRLTQRYNRNIQTLELMKRAIESGDYSELRQYAGSMGPMAFPSGIPTPDAPFKVVMGFLANMQLVGHGLGVIRKGRRGESKEEERCPVCESQLCRCCPDCEQPECRCEEDAADRIKMISDFIPEDL